MGNQIEYIETGVNWLSKIPSTWESKRIKMLTRVKRGASPRPIDNPIYFDEEGEFAWVRIADVTASERYLENTTQRLSELGSSLSVKRYPDDFFLSIAGTVGKPIITKIKCCIHDGFVYFPDLKINPEFLYYIFSTGLPYLGLGKMGTQLNLNTDTVGDIYIPIPEDTEIEKIVNYLDERTAEIDNLIFRKQKLIECLKEERLVQIRLLTTKGIEKKQFKNSGIDWIGEIPNEWEAKKLKYVSRKVQTGNTPPTSKDEYYGDDFDWFTPADFSDNLLLENSSRKISFLAVQDEVVRVFPENSVLIVGIGATLGKVGYITSPASSNQQINAIVFSSIEEAKFYANLFYAFKDVVLSKSNASTLAILNQAQTKDFIVPVPAEQELPLIVSEIEELNTRIENTIRKIEQEIELIKEYRTSLINEVVTGKITLN